MRRHIPYLLLIVALGCEKKAKVSVIAETPAKADIIEEIQHGFFPGIEAHTIHDLLNGLGDRYEIYWTCDDEFTVSLEIAADYPPGYYNNTDRAMLWVLSFTSQGKKSGHSLTRIMSEYHTEVPDTWTVEEFSAFFPDWVETAPGKLDALWADWQSKHQGTPTDEPVS